MFFEILQASLCVPVEIELKFIKKLQNCTTVVETAGHLIEPEIRLNSAKK